MAQWIRRPLTQAIVLTGKKTASRLVSIAVGSVPPTALWAVDASSMAIARAARA
jgi:hypothetical protein